VGRGCGKCNQDGLWYSEVCDVTQRLCDVTQRLCDVTQRLCDVTQRLCDVTQRLCDVTQRLCDVTLKLCDVTQRLWQDGRVVHSVFIKGREALQLLQVLQHVLPVVTCDGAGGDV